MKSWSKTLFSLNNYSRDLRKCFGKRNEIKVFFLIFRCFRWICQNEKWIVEGKQNETRVISLFGILVNSVNFRCGFARLTFLLVHCSPQSTCGKWHQGTTVRQKISRLRLLLFWNRGLLSLRRMYVRNVLTTKIPPLSKKEVRPKVGRRRAWISYSPN